MGATNLAISELEVPQPLTVQDVAGPACVQECVNVCGRRSPEEQEVMSASDILAHVRVQR